jgi:hypothetical protein
MFNHRPEHTRLEGGETIMSQKTFSITAAVVFLLIAVAHLLRVLLGVSFVINNISVPMWISMSAVFVMGYLAYAGFHSARKS